MYSVNILHDILSVFVSIDLFCQTVWNRFRQLPQCKWDKTQQHLEGVVTTLCLQRVFTDDLRNAAVDKATVCCCQDGIYCGIGIINQW